MAVLHNQIKLLNHEVLKRSGMTQAILLSLKEEILHIKNPERKNVEIDEILGDHKAALESAERNFEFGFEQQLILEKIDEPMFAGSIFPAALGLLVQIALLAGLVGWGIALAFSRI